MRSANLLLSLLVFAGIFLLLPAPDARACGGSLALEDQTTRDLRRAEFALEAAEYRHARRWAENVFLAEDFPTPDQLARARWLIAMSWVRDPYAPTGELVKSVETLRGVRSGRPAGDVVSAVDLGEALARLPEGKAEAKRILEPLATADLIGSPHAYAGLVRIGDLRTRVTAFARCRGMSEDTTFCVTGFAVSARERVLPHLGFGLAAVVLAVGLAIAGAFATGILRARRRAVGLRAAFVAATSAL